MERVSRCKQDYKEAEPFSIVEIKKILKALDRPYREFFQFAIWTGLRTGELLGLRWQDVDLNKGQVHIRTNITQGREKEPKTRGSIRTIELLFEAINALESIKNQNTTIISVYLLTQKQNKRTNMLMDCENMFGFQL